MYVSIYLSIIYVEPMPIYIYIYRHALKLFVFNLFWWSSDVSQSVLD